MSIIAILIIPIILEKKLLYQDRQAISLIEEITTDKKDNVEISAFLDSFSKQNHMAMLKIIQPSSSEKLLFTNDKVFLEERFKKSSKAKSLDWYDNRQHVTVLPLTDIHKFGLSGTYFINKNYPESNFQILKKELYDKYKIKLDKDNWYQPGYLIVLKSILDKPYLIVVFLILSILTLSSYIFVCIQNSKKYTLEILTGFTFKNIVFNSFKIMKLPLLLGSIVSILIFTFYSFFVLQSFSGIWCFTLFLVLLLFFFSAIFVILESIWLIFFYRTNSYNIFLKGKKNFLPLIFASKIFQIMLLVSLPTVCYLLTNAIIETQQQLSGEKSWTENQDIYATTMQFITSDYNLKRSYEKVSKEFYINNDDKLILIDVSNFDKMVSGAYVYEVNSTSYEDQLTSPYGRSIYINKQYLTRNHIKDEHGNIIDSEISISNHVLNLLVPAKLKEFENSIIEKFKEDYKFKSYDIPIKIYNEEVTENDIDINIIYTAKNQRYFTFNDQILGDNGYQIIDPIAIIDNRTLDASQYSAWLSNSIYFANMTNHSGLDGLQPEIEKYRMQDQLQMSFAIYDSHAQNIRVSQNLQWIYIFLIFLLLTSLFMYAFYFFFSILGKHHKLNQLKIYSGYSKLLIYKSMYLFIVWDLFFLSLGSLIFKAPFKFYLLFIIFTIDILSMILSIYLDSLRKDGLYA